MPLLDSQKSNFQTMIDAARAGALSLMDCQDKKTGKQVAAVCAVNFMNGEYEFVPLAKLFDANPYDELNPPMSGGGYEGA